MKAGFIAAACILAALGIVGTADYEDARAQDAEYCANVAKGVWPDYNKNYREICKNGLPRSF